jgi:type II secretory pathway predicted ATPase ExeA
MAVPRTQFYHPARVIDAAMHAIDRAIRRAEGISLVVGPPGTGKSLLLAKVGESVAEDFKVALLSGARICTRRALWQSILVDLGQPYRGIDEAELRIAVAEIVRGLAASGSGLVILVDEAHTLPLRLIEELRLLANMPTPLPAVHIVLAGPAALEERLGTPKMESFAQRIAVRSYLEPLDHAETVAYLRTQTKAAGLDWDTCFEPGCDDAVYSAADGVPRLMNQLCDQAIVLVADARRRVKPSDIAAAWQEIQKLPSPALFGHLVAGETCHDSIGIPTAVQGGMADTDTDTDTYIGIDHSFDGSSEGYIVHEHGGDSGVGVIEFGSLDDQPTSRAGDVPMRPMATLREIIGMDDHEPTRAASPDPWHGPDVEFVFDASTDPFQEFFEQEERIVERYLMRSPDDFSRHQHVASCEGAALVRQLAELADDRSGVDSRTHDGRSRGGIAGPSGGESLPAMEQGPRVTPPVADVDDSDMVVIEEDLLAQPGGRPAVAAVRLGDYRRLFARLRRGG